MYLSLAFTYPWIACHIPPLILLSIINNTSILVNRSNFTLVLNNVACHADPGAEKKWAGSSQYISRQVVKYNS